MKKILLLFVIALLIVSCDDKSKDIQMTNVDLIAKSSDWVANVDNVGVVGYYSVHFDMPEITSGVFNNGMVTAYIVIDNNPTVQEPLPYIRHYQNLNGTLWTQTIDFDYSSGGITIYVTNSNFVDNPPSTMNFRIVIL